MAKKIVIYVGLVIGFVLATASLFFPDVVPFIDKIQESWALLENPILAILIIWGVDTTKRTMK